MSSDKAVLNGEPVFKGTRIPVRLIAAMLEQGADEDELLEGYPKLCMVISSFRELGLPRTRAGDDQSRWASAACH